LEGVWTRGASEKKLGPLRIFATIEASNFKFGTKLGFGISLPKHNVKDQNWRGSRLGEHPKKIWDPLHISATVEADKFKCGTQIGFGNSLAKTTFKIKIGGGLARGTSEKKLGPPTYFCNH